MTVYSLDGKCENASNTSSTNIIFWFRVHTGWQPVVRLAKSISWMSSSVSGDTSHFGLDVVGLASLSAVSLVSGEASCHHGHTVEGDAKNSVGCCSCVSRCSRDVVAWTWYQFNENSNPSPAFNVDKFFGPLPV